MKKGELTVETISKTNHQTNTSSTHADTKGNTIKI